MRIAIRLGVVVALGVPQSAGAQSHIPRLDTLRAYARGLAGCYQFSWPDPVPALPTSLPGSLELRPVTQRALGYHRLLYFQVRPAEVKNGYRLWKPMGRDSLEIELMASTGMTPQDVLLTGRVARDTLTGQVVQLDVVPDTTRDFPKFTSSVRGRFVAVRSKCGRRGAA